ncbi:hypothetical protein [Rhodopirellula sp. P2]|uniref:hypothetical protein n=1 Tax=Rhodopirellula sp. P2 TaxID=2127060 RepID=UPI002368EC51|nr:hypothetical protein [Rhodopirellula sp. P2]WDQ19186.1 hypothetical protein PSR62_11790 [Rhodopirellula sp. P2]
MKRSIQRLFLGLAVVAGCVACCEEASAQSPYAFGFQPYGFYQPYGSVYRSSIPNPPYFATNPPVYYGTRHYRPYGVSPFASPPVVSPGADYRSQVAPMNQRRGYVGPVSNPYICKAGESTSHLVTKSKADATKSSEVAADSESATTLVSNSADFTPGKVQANPFVSAELQFAQR